MRSSWVAVCGLGMLIAAMPGCRTMPPELKPAKQPEMLSVPPPEARYDKSIYPKEAFNTPDLFKKRDSDNAIMPTRGGMGPGMMNSQGGRGPY